MIEKLILRSIREAVLVMSEVARNPHGSQLLSRVQEDAARIRLDTDLDLVLCTVVLGVVGVVDIVDTP